MTRGSNAALELISVVRGKKASYEAARTHVPSLTTIAHMPYRKGVGGADNTSDESSLEAFVHKDARAVGSDLLASFGVAEIT